MNNPQKAIGVILTIALLLAAAGAIIFMRACLKPSRVSRPSPVTKAAPIPRACCDTLGLPYTQTPMPSPSHEPAIARAKLSARIAAEPTPDTAWHYAGETIIIGTKDDGEAIYWTLSAGTKAIRSDIEVPDCHSYPERFVPCRIGLYYVSQCQKVVEGPPPNGSAFITQHHEPDPSCDYARARNQ